MRQTRFNFGLTALLCAGVLFGITGPSLAQHGKQQPKSHKKAVKTVVKYKAQCGMIYSAADAKKNHYICPMDHKPLKKIVGK